MFSKNRNKIKNILVAIIPGLLVVGFLAFANSSPKTIFDKSRLPDSKIIIDANDNNKRTVIVANSLETDEPEWQCGEDITFTYRGSQVTYGTVENPTTSKCWMDRNLGASRVAQSYDDSQAYGDLFQWGRCTDDHQDRNSATYSGPVDTYICNDGNAWDGDFITVRSGSPYDWVSPQEHNLWQGDGGINDPCPVGWRIPTETEVDDEYESWSQKNRAGAFASPLKLPAGGRRDYYDGSLEIVGNYGGYWSSTVTYGFTMVLFFYSDSAAVDSYGRAQGLSVRCVKD